MKGAGAARVRRSSETGHNAPPLKHHKNHNTITIIINENKREQATRPYRMPPEVRGRWRRVRVVDSPLEYSKPPPAVRPCFFDFFDWTPP